VEACSSLFDGFPNLAFTAVSSGSNDVNLIVSPLITSRLLPSRR
jgi:hypothetical protein